MSNQVAKSFIENENKLKETKLTKQQIEDNYVDFIAFYRANLGIFNKEYLGIHISPFQEIMLDVMDDYDDVDIIASRGLSKSFITALRALDVALLYPNSEVLVTSLTIAQANLLIEEKIKNTFCARGGMFSSDVLCQLREDGWITFKTDDKTGGLVVNFGNQSWIKAVVCGEGGRGQRSTYVIVDEFVLVKKKDYDEIIEPTKHPRIFKHRGIDYPEQPKTTKLSSARTKSNWGWNDLKRCVTQHYKDGSCGFYIGDIFTAVASGILTPKQYYRRRQSTNDLSFLQEYMNIFLGENEDSIFKYEFFDKNRRVKEAFYPRTPQDIMYGNPQKYKFRDDEVRFLVSDIAVSSGEDNDYSTLLLGKINKRTYQLSLEYLETANGMNSNDQVKLMKRYFYEYKCDYFVFDSRGIGNVIYDIFTVETPDPEYGTTYPAWTVNAEADIQLCSDVVMTDKQTRTITKDAKKVIIPFVGNAELNSAIHLTTRKLLQDECVDILIDDYDRKADLIKDDAKFITKTSEEKADILAPYMQCRYMVNEAVALEAKFTEAGLLKVQEAKRTNTKDRYMTFAMFCYFGEKLRNKYFTQNQNEDDIDFDDIQLVF